MFGDISRDKSAYVRALFAAIARRYDLINSLLSLGRDGAWRRFAASKSDLPAGGMALDLATGTGGLARQLALRNRHSTVVGVDFCPEMLRLAKSRIAASADEHNIELALGDVLRLPFVDDSFDSVTVGFALRNVADIAAIFQEAARVAKPGGRVVSLELTRPSSALVGAIHRFSLFHMAPLVGGLISGTREAYTYLPNSIMEFPSPEAVSIVMEKAGLRDVQTCSLTFGAATVHEATKASKPGSARRNGQADGKRSHG